MFGLLMFAALIALCVVLMPALLGVVATMLQLMLTAILFVFAGCPDASSPKLTEAERHARDKSMEQIEAWLDEGQEVASDAAAKAARKSRKALKEAL